MSTILFLRHTIATPADKSKTGVAADISRVATPEGVQLAEATAETLANEKFDLMVTSGVPRTVQTGIPIAALQDGLKAIVGNQSLYAPIDRPRADEIFAIFNQFPKPRQAMDQDAIRRYYGGAITALISEIYVYDAKDILVVNHGGVIQILVAILGHGQFQDVLDLELAPCDGIKVTLDKQGNMTGYDVFRAPKPEAKK